MIVLTRRHSESTVKPILDGRNPLRAHEGQKDKVGQPYFLHPLPVMIAVEGEPAKVVAILHDVIEDTAITEDDLRREGFSERVLAALACVTHRKGEPYAEYVVRCKGDEIARRATRSNWSRRGCGVCQADGERTRRVDRRDEPGQEAFPRSMPHSTCTNFGTT